MTEAVHPFASYRCADKKAAQFRVDAVMQRMDAMDVRIDMAVAELTALHAKVNLLMTLFKRVEALEEQ